jgi:hypothetical protein
MNVDKTQRMFKDELPFWREHIKCIRENVSDYMGDLAAYYYYRRLLFYYVDTNNKGIADLVKHDLHEVKRIYSKEKNIVSRGDRARMNIFLTSPKLYLNIVKFYDKVIIPTRQRSSHAF